MKVDADKLTDLEKRLKSLEQSGKSFWKRLGMVLGVIGGLIAIPKAISDSWVVLFPTPPTPQVELTWGPDVKLSFDPQTKNVNLIYPLTISNAKGTADDRIISASVKLQVLQQNDNPYFVATPSIYFESTNLEKHRVPLTIFKEKSMDGLLYVSFTQNFARYALAKPGTRETEVSFSLQSRKTDKPVSQKFCLHDMGSDALEAIVGGQPWRPLSTSCEKD